jgi:hypothetical protein
MINGAKTKQKNEAICFNYGNTPASDSTSSFCVNLCWHSNLRWSEDIPSILYFGARLRWVISFIPWTIYLGKEPRKWNIQEQVSHSTDCVLNHATGIKINVFCFYFSLTREMFIHSPLHPPPLLYLLRVNKSTGF